MPDCAECGKHYERVKNLESHRRAEHPTDAEKRILVDGLSPDPPSDNVVPFDREPEFIDGIELVEDDALSQAGFFNHPERAAERARLNREVAEKITSDQKDLAHAALAEAIQSANTHLASRNEPVATGDVSWEQTPYTEMTFTGETLPPGAVIHLTPEGGEVLTADPRLAAEGGPDWTYARFEQENRLAAPGAIVRSHPSVLPPPGPRRHLDYVKHRCWDGYPEPMDAKWLLARVEEADSLLRVLAQPHILAEWNRSLSE